MRADPVLVPRWYCTFGTVVSVVAATNEADARAIVRSRLRSKAISHHAREIKVRALSIDDERRLAEIAAAETARR